MSPYFSKTATPLCEAQLDLPPCCMEFVPYEYGREQYLVVGTYSVKECLEIQPRHGTLNLFKLEQWDDIMSITLHQNIPYSAGIYDLHFIPGTNILVISSTTGCISTFKIVPQPENADELRIEHISDHQIFEKDVIITSFALNPLVDPPLLAATSSEGTVCLVQFKDRFGADTRIHEPDIPFPIHEAYGSQQYAYCCAWFDGTLFTGGDDGYLRTSAPFSKQNTPHQRFEPHTAGILSILPLSIPPRNPASEATLLLLTGGYDDHIRVHSLGKNQTITPLTELNVGQGVYKIKHLSTTILTSPLQVVIKVLASCTNAGVRIFSITGTGDDAAREWKIDILASVTQHRSLCYASGMMHTSDGKADGIGALMASASMYDKLLCVWRFDESLLKERGDGLAMEREEGELVRSET